MSAAEKIADQAKSRKWSDARGREPSKIKDAGSECGILRLDFDKPEEISSAAFFKISDDDKLALLAQEETRSGDTTGVLKFVKR